MHLFSLPDEPYKRILVLFAYGLIGLFLLFVTVQFLLPVLLPFLLAWVLARVLQPLLNLCMRAVRLPRRPAALLFVLLFVGVAGGVLYLFVSRIVGEIRSFLAYLTEHGEAMLSSFTAFAERVAQRFPLSLGIDTDAVLAAAAELFTSTVSNLTAALPGVVMTVVKALPGMLFFSFVLLFSSYYLCVDFDAVNKGILALFPPASRDGALALGKHLRGTLLRYLRAYLLIMFITFSELLVGFLILRIDYAFTLALLISLIDIFPVLGVGTVLIPMAAVKVIGGDLYTGIGLIIVFAIVQIVRQVSEPRIIGVSFGMPPLLTVFSMYAGWRLLGVWGVLMLPVAATLIYGLFLPAGKQGREEKRKRV